MATEKQERQKPHDVTKVIVRCIPASTSEQELLELFSEWTEQFESFYWLKNVASMEQAEMCRLYVGFKDLQKALAFHGNFDGYVQNQNRLVVELAPYPRLPKSARSKVDAKQGSIDQDPEYLNFVETYESENPLKLKESALSAQSNQEQLLIEMEKRKEAKASYQNDVTPLIQSIIDSRTRKDDLSVKIRQEERRKREREVEMAAKKVRDEERRKMLDKKEVMLKEQREKERHNKSQKVEEKVPEKSNNCTVVESQTEEQSSVGKNAEDLVEKNGDNKFSEKVNDENKTENAKIAPVSATSRASRLKDLPSIKYYTPAAKAAKAASSTESVPEERSYSFLNRDIDENGNSSRGSKRGFGRRGGGSGPGREIKPSRGMHNGGPAYSSRGEKKRENRKDSNPQSQEAPMNVETSNKAREEKEKKDRASKNSAASESLSSTSEDTAASDPAKTSQEGEFKKQTGPSIVKYPRDTVSENRSKNSRGPKSKAKQNRRQGADDWDMYDDSRQGHPYYDCPPAFYSSSWSRGAGKGSGGPHHGGYSSRIAGYNQNQRQFDYGYGHNRSSYDYDRYGDRAPASAGHSGKGGNQKVPPVEKINRGSKFLGENKETKPVVFESAESRSLKKAEDGGKPPRFSDKRRATALSNNSQISVNAAP